MERNVLPKMYSNKIMRAQKCMLSRVCEAYRIVLNKTLSVIASIAPITEKSIRMQEKKQGTKKR